MPPLKAVAACLAVVVAGAAALIFVPMALEVWEREAHAVQLATALLTLAAVVAVARHMLPRPYLRPPVVVAAALAPLGIAGAVAGLVELLDLAGAHCPREGMDYISECNALAGAAMMVGFTGFFAVALSVPVAAGVLLGAAVQRIRAARRRAGSAPAAGGSR